MVVATSEDRQSTLGGECYRNGEGELWDGEGNAVILSEAKDPQAHGRGLYRDDEDPSLTLRMTNYTPSFAKTLGGQPFQPAMGTLPM